MATTTPVARDEKYDLEVREEHMGDDYLDKKGQTKNVENAELYAAIQASPIPRWSPAARTLYLCIFTAFLCSTANGYDGSLLTAILAMKHFQNTFHSGKVGPKVSVIFSLYTIGSICAALPAAWMSDRYGRRKTMFAGATVILGGMAISASAKTIAQFTVGRFVLGFGIAFMTVAGPVYASEVAPPHWKGRATALYNMGWNGGAIPAAAITFGTNFLNNNYSWQIPLILQAYSCVFVMISVCFVPESPRFLMTRGREQEAFEFLVKYHGNGREDAPLVQFQMAEWRAQISSSGSDRVWWDYRPLWANKNALWRTWQIVMISCFGQFCGNGLGYFNTVIYEMLGVKSVVKQLGLNLGKHCLSAFCSFISSSLADKVPHRPVLVFGSAGMATFLTIQAALSTVMNKQVEEKGAFDFPIAQAALFAYFMFSVCYAFCYTPLSSLIAAEAMDSNIRAKGMALHVVIVAAMLFINQFAGPIALDNIEYNYYWVFAALNIVYLFCWFFTYVETHGRTLEEMDWVYQQSWPPKAARSRELVAVARDGTFAVPVQE